MDRPGHACIKPPKAPPIWTGRLPLAVGMDSISARGVCVAAGRADIESAPTEVCRGARFQFWKYPCFENAAKRPPALPKAGGRPLLLSCGYPARRRRRGAAARNSGRGDSRFPALAQQKSGRYQNDHSFCPGWSIGITQIPFICTSLFSSSLLSAIKPALSFLDLLRL